MKSKFGSILFLVFILIIGSCNDQPEEDKLSVPNTISVKAAAGLSDYWYQGKAELSYYSLEQNRYQETHPGEAVLIFVTEDFLTDRQVKNDRYQNPNSTPILKTNVIRRFTTGLYDYSLMSSVFTPVDRDAFPHTLKVSSSAQDWCGQSWSQVNLKGKKYTQEVRSYFEQEGDQDNTVPAAILEDELMNLLRMGPDYLPTGVVSVIPANHYLQLRHQEFKAYSAEAVIKDYVGEAIAGDGLKMYHLEIGSLQRTLQIVFNPKAPFLIEGWIETYPSAFDDQLRETIARRRSTIIEPYWKLNKKGDLDKRRDFGPILFE